MNKMNLRIIIDILVLQQQNRFEVRHIQVQKRVNNYREDFVFGFVHLETFRQKSYFRYKLMLLKIHFCSGQTEAFLLKLQWPFRQTQCNH